MVFEKRARNLLYVLACLCSPIGYTQNMHHDPIEVLRKADLNYLIKTDKALNLAAQPLVEGSKMNVEDFNDFIALGSSETSSYPSTNNTNMANFDENGNLIKQILGKKAWIGVQSFEPKTLPSLSLKKGLDKLKKCMKDDPIVNQEVANVIIYQTIKNKQFVYDYAFKTPNNANCQEILYTPLTNTCEYGMVRACHISIEDMQVMGPRKGQ